MVDGIKNAQHDAITMASQTHPAQTFPDFVPVYPSEEEIIAPAKAIGRCHTGRLYGDGPGRIPWSPVTQRTLAESGWLPKGMETVPDIYTVIFVGPCRECRKKSCEHPISSRAITGEIVVNTHLRKGKRRGVILSYEDFKAEDLAHQRRRFRTRTPRKKWEADGKGPVSRCAALLDRLEAADNEIALLETTYGSATLIPLKVLKEGLFPIIADTSARAKELSEKLHRRNAGRDG